MFYVAAHAEVYLLGGQGEVIQQETAWADGNQINESGSWATYADYCLQECNACEFVPEVFDLFGGQTILIGNVSVTNDDENLYVTYSTDEDWYIRETHLYVGTLDDLPVNGANTPVPGQFPYSDSFDPAAQSYTYTIPLDVLPDCYIIAAHAATSKIVDGIEVQEETAWSFGEEFPGTKRWGWYSSYCTQVCE